MDPAKRYVIHKIERHLDQLVEFGVFEKETVEQLVREACEKRDLDYNDYIEGHWTRK